MPATLPRLAFGESRASREGGIHGLLAAQQAAHRSLVAYEPLGPAAAFEHKSAVVTIGGLRLAASAHSPVRVVADASDSLTLVVPFSGWSTAVIEGRELRWLAGRSAMYLPGVPRLGETGWRSTLSIGLDPVRLEQAARCVAGATDPLSIRPLLAAPRLVPLASGGLSFATALRRICGLIDACLDQTDTARPAWRRRHDLPGRGPAAAAGAAARRSSCHTTCRAAARRAGLRLHRRPSVSADPARRPRTRQWPQGPGPATGLSAALGPHTTAVDSRPPARRCPRPAGRPAVRPDGDVGCAGVWLHAAVELHQGLRGPLRRVAERHRRRPRWTCPSCRCSPCSRASDLLPPTSGGDNAEYRPPGGAGWSRPSSGQVLAIACGGPNDREHPLEPAPGARCLRRGHRSAGAFAPGIGCRAIGMPASTPVASSTSLSRPASTSRGSNPRGLETGAGCRRARRRSHAGRPPPRTAATP